MASLAGNVSSRRLERAMTRSSAATATRGAMPRPTRYDTHTGEPLPPHEPPHAAPVITAEQRVSIVEENAAAAERNRRRVLEQHAVEVQAKAAEAKAKKDAELGAGAKKKSAAPLPESLARKFPGKTATHIQNMIAQQGRMDPGDELDLPELSDSEKEWLWSH